MRIVEPYARLFPPPHVDISNGFSPFTEEHGLQLLRRVEYYARISHRSEEKQTADSYTRFLRTWVMEHGDFSTIEHCIISADLLVDRGLSHELVRHRLAKFADENIDIDVSAPEVTQESTRFCNYGKKNGEIDVVSPVRLRLVHEILKRFQGNHVIVSSSEMVDNVIEAELVGIPPDVNEASRLVAWYRDWMQGVEEAEKHYLRQLELKVPPEETRDMLPHCLAVRMVMTHNLRNWRHLLIMRTTNETHRKLRPLMIDLLTEIKVKVPILYDDLDPNVKQSENLKRGR